MKQLLYGYLLVWDLHGRDLEKIAQQLSALSFGGSWVPLTSLQRSENCAEEGGEVASHWRARSWGCVSFSLHGQMYDHVLVGHVNKKEQQQILYFKIY